MVRRRRCVLLVTLLPLFGCETLAPTSGRTLQHRDAGLIRTSVDFATGAEALQRFVPAVEPQFGGGECSRMPAPAIPVLPPGSRLVQVSYPRMPGAHTTATVALDSAGRIVQYQEIRGVPTSTSPDFRQAVDEMSAMRSTIITIDYVRSRGTIVNSGGSEPNTGVRASLADFEADPRFGDLLQRADRVLAFCPAR